MSRGSVKAQSHFVYYSSSSALQLNSTQITNFTEPCNDSRSGMFTFYLDSLCSSGALLPQSAAVRSYFQKDIACPPWREAEEPHFAFPTQTVLQCMVGAPQFCHLCSKRSCSPEIAPAERSSRGRDAAACPQALAERGDRFPPVKGSCSHWYPEHRRLGRAFCSLQHRCGQAPRRAAWYATLLVCGLGG